MKLHVDLTQGPSLMPPPRGDRRRMSAARGFDVKRAKHELAHAEAEKAQHLPSWRAGVNLTMPDRNNFDGKTPGSARQPQELVDSYGLRALRRGQGAIVASMCPPDQFWGKVVAGVGIPEDRREAIAPGLERVTQTFFEYLGKSRFAAEAHTMAADLMLSTGCLTIDKGTREKPFRVQAVPLNECYPVEGPDGDIQNMYRKYCVRPANLKAQWPMLVLTSRLRRIMEQDPAAEAEVVEATTYEDKRGFRFTIFDPADDSILYDVPPSDPSEPSRWITPRLYTRPGESYGVGCVIEALPTLRTMNKLQEISLKAGARFYQPPLLIDSMSGQNPHTMRLSPNSIGMFNGAALNGRTPFVSLPANGVPQWGNLEIERMHALVDDIMFANEIVGPTEDLKGVTATAVTVRKQQLLLQQGVDLGRLQHEFPYAVMRRGLWILSTLGVLDMPINVDQFFFDIDYLGPLAQAQKAERANNVLGFVSAIRGSVGDQMASLGIRTEDASSIVGEMWPDVPAELLRTKQERDDMQKQAAQVAAAQAAGAAPTMDASSLPGADLGVM